MYNRETHYQTIDFLGDQNKSSNSFKKFQLSKIHSYNLKNKNMLDIGCNSGYFCFKMASIAENGTIVGIDRSAPAIKDANFIKTTSYPELPVNFIEADIFEYDFKETKFDFIICFSTFHYFADKQKEFLDKVGNMLSHNGIFILEAELHPSEDCNVYKCVRPADAATNIPLDYPTLTKIKQWTNQKLSLILEGDESVFQPGSLFPRKFFHFKKDVV